uniref:Uncharacterized protein n=1 Tax=Triticum urartu TaxID=4572 RepID=A0A8R7QWB7_TRIUA
MLTFLQLYIYMSGIHKRTSCKNTFRKTMKPSHSRTQIAPLAVTPDSCLVPTRGHHYDELVVVSPSRQHPRG